jgi:hypothetical protein
MSQVSCFRGSLGIDGQPGSSARINSTTGFVAKPMGKAVTALTAVSDSQGGSGYYFAK